MRRSTDREREKRALICSERRGRAERGREIRDIGRGRTEGQRESGRTESLRSLGKWYSRENSWRGWRAH